MKKYTCEDHTPSPTTYVEKQEWMFKKSKTHRQIRCDECGLWEIWITIQEWINLGHPEWR